MPAPSAERQQPEAWPAITFERLPALYSIFAGTVPTAYSLFASTVPAFSLFLTFIVVVFVVYVKQN